MENIDFEPLNLLLKASSKDVIIKLCNDSFLHRHLTTVPQTVLENAANSLGVDATEAKQLMVSLRGLVKNALYQGSTEPAEVVKLFPDNFHKNLRDLLGKIIKENLPSWKTQAINNLVSLPRLVEMDWRVDVKTSSDSVARMSVPTCLLQLQVEEPEKVLGSAPEVNSVTVELSKETLDTMLDGLGKIRDQLSSVAGKT